ADEPSSGNLRLSAGRILTCLFATYSCILTCTRSTAPYGTASLHVQRSPTTLVSFTRDSALFCYCACSKGKFGQRGALPDVLSKSLVKLTRILSFGAVLEPR